MWRHWRVAKVRLALRNLARLRPDYLMHPEHHPDARREIEAAFRRGRAKGRRERGNPPAD